jgi:hypothetical protein
MNRNIFKSVKKKVLKLTATRQPKMHWTEVLRQRAVSSGDNGMCKSISSIARHNLAADHLYWI